MKYIYILLTKSDIWVSKLIRVSTDDQYTHASISFEESLQEYLWEQLPQAIEQASRVEEALNVVIRY